MTTHKGYYSLIQYCPDASRAEAANVGVLLFCPTLRFIEAKTAKDHARITRFFGKNSFDPWRVTAAKQAVEEFLRLHKDRFDTIDDLRHFIATRANDITLTDPRPMNVVDPEQELTDLFEQLVGSTGHTRHHAAIPELEQAMHSRQLEGRIRFNDEIDVPVLGTKMKIPYSYENGQPNLIRPTAFQPEEAPALRQATFLACAGDMLLRKPDNQGRQSRLIIVSAMPVRDYREGEQIEQHVQKVFDEYNVPFYRRNRINDLIEQVRQNAHPLEARA